MAQFDQDYVMKVTLANCVKAVDVSINKTMARIPEFADDQEKSNEIFITLATLQSLKEQLSGNIKVFDK